MSREVDPRIQPGERGCGGHDSNSGRDTGKVSRHACHKSTN